ERARIDERRLVALGGVAAVAAARRPAVAVGILVFVDLAVAVVVDAVAADLADRHDLTVALAPRAVGLAGLRAAVTRADAVGDRQSRIAILRVTRPARARLIRSRTRGARRRERRHQDACLPHRARGSRATDDTAISRAPSENHGAELRHVDRPLEPIDDRE